MCHEPSDKGYLILLLRYDAEKARASAQAQAEAQSKVQEEISRILSMERALTQDSLEQTIIRERISNETEKLRAQLLVTVSGRTPYIPSFFNHNESEATHSYASPRSPIMALTSGATAPPITVTSILEICLKTMA
ncbi:hypothetical protein CHARACLAT_015153 [Characodon lateralis]|uniref:Uncharacterized protein n=1 Tax=Characodon lateralis TaxID=208331 RepID=A0ABU7DB80_9TELE|nr:hypothetical protein [Characodon lateralis]